ncbi:MAG: hypothetical protein ABS904_00885 [Solibacillus isronensis]
MSRNRDEDHYNEGVESEDEARRKLLNGELNFNLDEPDDSFVTGVTPPPPPPTNHNKNTYQDYVEVQLDKVVPPQEVDEDDEYFNNDLNEDSENYQRGYEELTDEELLQTLTEEEEYALEGVLPEEQADFIRALRSQSTAHQTSQWQEPNEPNYYLTPEEQQQLEMQMENERTKKKLTTIIVSAVAALFIAVGAYVYFFTDIIKGEAEPTIPAYEEQITELISLMYDAQGVDELASANPAILNYFDESIQPQNDIRDSNIYAERYGYFFNAPTKVSVKEVKQLESELFIRYTIECELASPLTRIALVTINEQGKITRFNEYNTY